MVCRSETIQRAAAPLIGTRWNEIRHMPWDLVKLSAPSIEIRLMCSYVDAAVRKAHVARRNNE